MGCSFSKGMQACAKRETYCRKGSPSCCRMPRSISKVTFCALQVENCAKNLLEKSVKFSGVLESEWKNSALEQVRGAVHHHSSVEILQMTARILISSIENPREGF